MHNNAIGPELCGNPKNAANDFYKQRPRYVDSSSVKLLPADQQPKCLEYDPSVDGRFKLYTASMEELLNPARRIPKVTLLSKDITLRIGPKLWDGSDKESVMGFQLTIPHDIDGRGVTAGTIGNFQHKQFVGDLVLAKVQPASLETKLAKRLGAAEGKRIAVEMAKMADEVIANPRGLVDAVKRRPYLVKDIYSSCTAEVENAGHRFGEDLAADDKQALIAFLATL